MNNVSDRADLNGYEEREIEFRSKISLNYDIVTFFGGKKRRNPSFLGFQGVWEQRAFDFMTLCAYFARMWGTFANGLSTIGDVEHRRGMTSKIVSTLCILQGEDTMQNLVNIRNWRHIIYRLYNEVKRAENWQFNSQSQAENTLERKAFLEAIKLASFENGQDWLLLMMDTPILREEDSAYLDKMDFIHNVFNHKGQP